MAGHGVPHTLIVDNAGGHFMQHGMVDMVIVGTDRTTANGDVCNKIGTYLKALAAHDKGIPVHVWVDETRPRNQGASLTAWELGKHGVPHTVIADNAGGHLMQHGKVDFCIVGTDRTTRRGDRPPRHAPRAAGCGRRPRPRRAPTSD